MNRIVYEKRERNYIAEATAMVNELNNTQIYELYEVVQKQKQRSQTPERDAELNAVEKVIEARRDLDRSKLEARKRGYRSSMAQDARAKDGNTDKHKRRV